MDKAYYAILARLYLEDSDEFDEIILFTSSNYAEVIKEFKNYTEFTIKNEFATSFYNSKYDSFETAIARISPMSEYTTRSVLIPHAKLNDSTKIKLQDIEKPEDLINHPDIIDEFENIRNEEIDN